MFNKVSQFNKEILGKNPSGVSLLELEEMKLSLHQLREEVQEVEDAFNDGSIVDVVDGLIDLEYFLLGVLYKMGIDHDVYAQCFSIIHEKNMSKKMGKKEGRSQYDAADAIKPEGWVGPEEEMAGIIFGRLGREFGI